MISLISLIAYLSDLSWIDFAGMLTLLALATGRKLNVHKTFKGHLGRLLQVWCSFNLYSASWGFVLFKEHFNFEMNWLIDKSCFWAYSILEIFKYILINLPRHIILMWKDYISIASYLLDSMMSNSNCMCMHQISS